MRSRVGRGSARRAADRLRRRLSSPVGTGRRRGCRAARMAKLLDAEQQRPLGLGQATPDAVGLTGGQRVLSAFGHHRAVVTDHFRALNPPPSVSAAFFERVEEHFHVHPAAGGEQLPVPFLADRLRQTAIDVQRALPQWCGVVWPAGFQRPSRISPTMLTKCCGVCHLTRRLRAEEDFFGSVMVRDHHDSGWD